VNLKSTPKLIEHQHPQNISTIDKIQIFNSKNNFCLALTPTDRTIIKQKNAPKNNPYNHKSKFKDHNHSSLPKSLSSSLLSFFFQLKKQQPSSHFSVI
jgi:hypothetical protein